MLCREGQCFLASPEEKYMRDTSYCGGGEPRQQRRKRVTAAASGKCCADPAGPTAGKRMGRWVMEGARHTLPSHHRVSGLLFSCGSPAPCPVVLQCLSYIRHCPEKDPGACAQNLQATQAFFTRALAQHRSTHSYFLQHHQCYSNLCEKSESSGAKHALQMLLPGWSLLWQAYYLCQRGKEV